MYMLQDDTSSMCSRHLLEKQVELCQMLAKPENYSIFYFKKKPPKPSKQLASMQTVKNSCTEFPVQMPFLKFIIRTWNIIWAWNFY